MATQTSRQGASRHNTDNGSFANSRPGDEPVQVAERSGLSAEPRREYLVEQVLTQLKETLTKLVQDPKKSNSDLPLLNISDLTIDNEVLGLGGLARMATGGEFGRYTLSDLDSPAVQRLINELNEKSLPPYIGHHYTGASWWTQASTCSLFVRRQDAIEFLESE